MKKVRLSELSESVRSFLDRARQGDGIMIEDENGAAQYGVIPYQQATAEERQQAWAEIEQIQREVGESMRKQGVTEDDVDRLLQQDD